MINSMTGFGEGQGRLNGVTYAVEIRAVNSRYFKAKIKLPEPLAFLEEDIEKVLREELSRGMVNYVLRLKDVPADTLFEINEKALRVYIERLSQLSSSSDTRCRIDIGSLLGLAGIMTPVLPDEQTAEKIRKAVLEITRQAIRKVQQMRQAEGTALAADLEERCKAIRKALKQICARSEMVLVEYQKKLRKKVDELLAESKLKLNEETLTREVAVFAERSDISEEIARLGSHLQQFTRSCQVDEQSGRKLDFISQEMLREANTIASKACDTEIVNCVVEIKCQIDRIKEQVQNIA
jgi:uncharacterized protein (TIGR00255 family)